MEELRNALVQEIRELERIEEAAKRDLKQAPKGTLRIARNNNTEQYYWRTDPKDTRGKYIRKKEEKLIKSLAQKDYARKVLAVLEPVIRKEKRFQKFQEINGQEQVLAVYKNLSPERKKLITPYLDAEEKFAEKWEYEKKLKKEGLEQAANIQEVSTEIYTEKGECVRSKSEKILADKLYMMNVPYLYEVPLYVEGYGYIKPDFTVLNKRTRKEFYWEHLGMMDDKEYCGKAIKKIETFEKNAIFPGKNLILTYETKEHPLNTKIVELLVEEYLV